MPHLLVVEDDPALRNALVRALRDRGHAVATAATGMAGLDAAVTDRPDLVVLDLGLPDVDGAQVLRMLRAVSDVPVIVATARDEEGEMVAVLGDGADDYIVKPFGAAQLDARIKAVLRRLGLPGDVDEPLTVGGLVITPASREITLDGQPLDLTPASSTSSLISPTAPARSSRAASCSPRCGSSRWAAPTRRWTSICRGCEGSWASRPSRRAICTPYARWV